MVLVSFNERTHVVVERSEVASINLVLGQLILVMHLVERQIDASDQLAFEARAARAMLQEHFPQLELPPEPE